MSQRLRRVFHDLGVLAHVPAAMCALSLPVAIHDGDRASGVGFAATAFIAVLVLALRGAAAVVPRLARTGKETT